jgi:hypothetical protein
VKKPVKIGLTIFGVVILIVIIWFSLAFVFPIFGLFNSYHKQMSAGRKYMDSLTEKDIQVWINRTQKYLDEFDSKADVINSKPVPPELEQLKILRIDEESNSVGYVWAGGLDHTELFVERRLDGNFQLTAVYNDFSNKVIWPKANP